MELSQEENNIFQKINDFRKDPKKSIPEFQTIKTGIQQMTPNNPIIKQMTNLIAACKKITKSKELRLSKILCKSAHDFIEKETKKNIDDLEDEFLEKDQTKDIIPKNFIKKNTFLFFDVSYSSPYNLISKIITNYSDPKKGLGKSFVNSNDVTQIGISLKQNDDQDFVCVIFNEDEDKIEEESNFEIEGVDLTELRMAFEALDPEKKGYIQMNEVIPILKEQGKDESDPALFGILNDLSKKNDSIDWPQFAKFCHEKMSDTKSDNGLETIFNIFLPNQEVDSIDFSQLKAINKKLNLGYSDEDIKKMLKLGTESKYGVNLNDFKERVNRKLKEQGNSK